MDQKLLIKFLNGKASLEEVRKILKWYYSEEAEFLFSEKIEGLWHEERKSEANQHFKKSEVLEIIREKIASDKSLGITGDIPVVKKKKSVFLNNLYKIAASFLLMMGIGYGIYQYLPGQEEEIVQHDEQPQVITKSTASGQKFTIFLGDGSMVKLNAESSLEFPSHFSDTCRLVHLTGEAFFDVKHDSLRPFKVITKNVVTTALGTSFNVSAYSDKKDIKISLASGKVRVNLLNDLSNSLSNDEFEVFLEPGKQAIYYIPDRTFEKLDFDTKKILSWKDGIIYFNDATWTEITDKLESWYGVQFIIEKEILTDKLYTGEFNNESLEMVLESLSFSKNFDYKIEEKKVYVRFN